jgi:hypothetical protein
LIAGAPHPASAFFLRGKHLNQKQIAASNIAGMFGRAIPARTGAKRAQKIYFRNELKNHPFGPGWPS